MLQLQLEAGRPRLAWQWWISPHDLAAVTPVQPDAGTGLHQARLPLQRREERGERSQHWTELVITRQGRGGGRRVLMMLNVLRGEADCYCRHFSHQVETSLYIYSDLRD